MNCSLRTYCLHFTKDVVIRNFVVEFVSATKLEYDKMVTPYSQDKGELQKGLGHCAIK